METLEQLLTGNNFDDFKIITDFNDVEIPVAWKEIITATTISAKKVVLNEYWMPVADKLPKTMHLINNSLEDIVLITEKGEYKLIYLFNIDDFISVYVGGLPALNGPFLKEMPDEIAMFYQQIHNGWYEQISGGLGFLHLNQIEWLGDNDWDILNDIPAPDLDLSKTFYVLHNAGSGYLCINVSNPDKHQYLIFWSDKEPKLNIPFWGSLDAWIEIGLTN